MLFALIAMFRDDVASEAEDLAVEVNEFLGQWTIQPRFGGVLRGEGGKRVGHLLLIEADSFEAARTYLSSEPYFQKGLYAHTEVAALTIEVGAVH